MRSRVRDNLWRCMVEDMEWRAEGWHELPIMYPRLSPWWPWHPAVVTAVGVVLVAVAFWVGQ
jgi:hypothetical protein